MIPPLPTEVAIPLRAVPRGYGLSRLLGPKVESADGGARAEQKASATPFDVDELALAIGRIPGLGIWPARAVMATGTMMAAVAAHEAVESIEDDLGLWSRSKTISRDLRPEQANIDENLTARNMQARRALITESATWPKKAASLATNVALLIGATGMGLNLLCADLMFGGLTPLLEPIAETSIVFAVWGMAAWGSALALQAIMSTRRAQRIAKSCSRAANATDAESAHARANAILRERAKKIPARDLAVGFFSLGLGGSALALQYLAAPLTLVTLAISTLGLVVARVRRDALRDMTVARWREHAGDLPQTISGVERALARTYRQHEACVHLRGTRFTKLPLGIGTYLVAPIARLFKRWSVEPWQRAALSTNRLRGLTMVNNFFGTRAEYSEATRMTDRHVCRQDLESLFAALYEIELMSDFAQAAAQDARLFAREERPAGWLRAARQQRAGVARALLPLTSHFEFNAEAFLNAIEALSDADCARITEHLFEHGVHVLENRGANTTSERMAYLSEILLARRALETPHATA